MNHSKIVQKALLLDDIDENLEGSVNILRERLRHLQQDICFKGVEFSKHAKNLIKSLEKLGAKA